jgi:hypothetical protein
LPAAFRWHAKQQLVEEVGDPLWVVAAAAQRQGQRGELLGRLPGQLLPGLAGPQRLGLLHDRPQDPQRLLRGVQQVAQREGMHHPPGWR